MTDFSSLARNLESAAISFGQLATSAGAFGVSVNSFRVFERQLTLTAAVAGATAEEFRELEDATRSFALNATASATTGANALYFLASAGFSASESLQAMSGVLLFAQATLSDAAQASDIIASNIRAFGLEARDAGRIANVFTATIANSQATIEKLGFALRQVGPVAAVAGLNIEQTSAFLGQLFNIGLRGEQAGTALRNIIVRLSAPVGEAREILTQFGIATIDAAGNMRQLRDILQDISDQNFSVEILSKIFGAEALAGSTALLASLNKTYQELFDEINGSNAAFAIASQQIDTLDGSLALARNSIAELAIAIGEAFAPAIREIALTINNVVIGFRSLDEETRNNIANIAAFAITGAGALGFLSTFGFALFGVTTTLSTSATLIGGMGRVLSVFGAALVKSTSAIYAWAASWATAKISIDLAGTSLGGVAGRLIFLTASLGAVTTALVGAAGLVLAWKAVSDAAEEAERAQRKALDLKVGNVQDKSVTEDQSRLIARIQENIRRIPAIFGGGFGQIEQLANFGEQLDQLRTVQNKIAPKLEKVQEGYNAIFEEQLKQIEEFEKQVKEIEERSGGPSSFLGLKIFTVPEALKIQLEEQIENVVEGSNAEGILDLARKGNETAKKLLSEIDKVAGDTLQTFEQAPEILDKRLTGLGPVIQRVFANEEFYQSLRTKIIEGVADRNLRSSQEISDLIIKEVIDQEKRLAEILTPALSVNRVLGSLEQGQKIFDREILKLRIGVLEQRARLTDDLSAALEAGLQAATLEFKEKMESVSEKQTKFLEETLSTVQFFAGTARLDVADNKQITTSLIDILTFKEARAEITEALNSGKSAEEIKIIADNAKEKTAELFEALKESVLRDKPILSELETAFINFGEALSVLSDDFAVNVLNVSDNLDKTRSRLARELRNQVNFKSTVKRLLKESELILLEAQQSFSELFPLNDAQAYSRGLDIINREYELAIDKAKQEVEQQRIRAKELGIDFNESVADTILDNARKTANVIRNEATEELVRGIKDSRKRIDREVTDLFVTFQEGIIEARRTILDKGIFAGTDDFLARALGLDQLEIIERGTRKLEDATRAFNDLIDSGRVSDSDIPRLQRQYDLLVQSIISATNAELAYTRSLEREIDRRVEAIDRQIRAIREAAIVSGNALEQVATGVQIAFLELQKQSITLVDITKTAFESGIDTITGFFADLIYETDNAVANVKKALLSISRTVFESITRSFIQNIVSSITAPGQGGILQGIFGSANSQIASPIVQQGANAIRSGVPVIQLSPETVNDLGVQWQQAVDKIAPVSGPQSNVPQGTLTVTGLENIELPSAGNEAFTRVDQSVTDFTNDLARGVAEASTQFTEISPTVSANVQKMQQAIEGITPPFASLPEVARDASNNVTEVFKNVTIEPLPPPDVAPINQFFSDIGTFFSDAATRAGSAVRSAGEYFNILDPVAEETARNIGVTIQDAGVTFDTATKEFSGSFEPAIGRQKVFYDRIVGDYEQLSLQSNQAYNTAIGYINEVPNGAQVFTVEMEESLKNAGQQFNNVSESAANTVNTINTKFEEVGRSIDNIQTDAITSGAGGDLPDVNISDVELSTSLDNASVAANNFSTQLSQAAASTGTTVATLNSQFATAAQQIVSQSGVSVQAQTQQIVAVAQQLGIPLEQAAQILQASVPGASQQIVSALQQGASDIQSGVASASAQIQATGNTLAGTQTAFAGQAATFQGGFSSALGSLVSGLGGIAQRFLGNIGPVFSQIVSVLGGLVSRLFQGGFGGSGGGLFGLFHEGGSVGSANSYRYIDIKTAQRIFAEAPNAHTGGIAGLLPGEVPIIARQGERVLTPEQYSNRNRDTSGGISVTMNVFGVTDADSFRRSENQFHKRLGRKLQNSREIA